MSMTISQISTLLGTQLQWVWWLICAVIVFYVMTRAHKYMGNFLVTGAIASAVIGMFFAMTLLPWWFVLVPIVMTIGGAIMERSPSL